MIFRGNSAHKRMTLTFDAGGGSGPTGTILDILRRQGVRATTFLTGSWAHHNRELVGRMVADGHQVGNHSYTHPDLTRLHQDQVRPEIEVTDGTIVAVTGRTPRPYFRPPYGAYDQTLVNFLGRLGYYTVLWTIDSGDWRPDWTPERVRDEVLKRAANGGIVVQHLQSEQTATVLESIIQTLRERGFEIVTLSRLLESGPRQRLFNAGNHVDP